MKIWRVVIFGLIVIAVGLMVAAIFLNLGSWNYLSNLRASLRSGQVPTPIHPDKMNTPQALIEFGGLIGLLFCGVIIVFMFPVQINYVGKALTRSPIGLARLFVIGFLSFVLFGIVGVSSALVAGIFPLVVFIGILLYMGIFWGSIALAYRLGRFLLTRAGWGNIFPLYPLFLGLVLLYSLVNLSLFGIICLVVIASLGLGATIVTRFGTGQPWSLKSLSEE